MDEKVSLDFEEFEAQMSIMNSKGDEFKIDFNAQLIDTDILPFVAYSEAIDSLKESIASYQGYLKADIIKFKEIADKIVETDKGLAK